MGRYHGYPLWGKLLFFTQTRLIEVIEMRSVLAFGMVFVMLPLVWGQAAYPPKLEGAREHVYKTVGETELKLFVYSPLKPTNGGLPTRSTAAVVFFFGGGWKHGSPKQFEQHCRYFAARGMVAITVDYRVASRHQVKAVDCVKDAQAAMRWVRGHADQLGVDPNRIAAAGGSAGGHLAACTAMIGELGEPSPDGNVSTVPNALVLFNPAAALAPLPGSPEISKERMNELAERMGIDGKAISPAHHVRANLPPLLMFFGTEDDLLVGATYLHEQMKLAGNRSELVTYPGKRHGFFNYGRGDGESFRDTLVRADRFLASLGWIQGEPTVDQFKWE